MIATNCNQCCFLVRTPDGPACVAAQFCNFNNANQVVTPGCCRLQRKKSWKDRQLVGKSIEDCLKNAREEMGLKFDLIVIFDESIHTLEQLKQTVEGDWCRSFCNKIVIADITGNKSREGLAIKYLQYEYKQLATVDLKVDCVVEQDEPNPITIRRIVKGLNKYIHYFMVVAAGQTISNLDKLNQHLMNADSRVALWHFPVNCGNTSLIEKYPCYGLYLAKAYRACTKPLVATEEGKDPLPNNHPFCVELQPFEDELGLSLVWLFDRCRLT